MSRFILILIYCVLFSEFSRAQNNFQINLTAPENSGKEFIMVTPVTPGGLEYLYSFTLDTNENVINLQEPDEDGFSYYSIQLKDNTILNGTIEYPVPVSLFYFDPEGVEPPVATAVFYLDTGILNIEFPKIENKLKLEVNSSVNNEYRQIKDLLSEVYVRATAPDKVDSLINFDRKQVLLAEYIRKNPDSFIALWQIIEDFTRYSDRPDYGNNLILFSEKIQNSILYKDINSRVKILRETAAQNIFPEVEVNEALTLGTEVFKENTLTLIDYWAISCRPCIENMPNMVRFQNEYLDKGLKIISIADENVRDRMDKANNILKENNANWSNYFDINNNFRAAVSAGGYPLYFLIDNKGRIIWKDYGNMDELEETVKKYYE